MKNILFISEYYTPVIHGGGEINLQLVAEALAEKGLRVTVLTSGFDGLKREDNVRGVRVLRWLRTGRYVDRLLDNVKRGLFFERSVVGAVSRIVAKEKVDAIHFIGSSMGCARRLRRFGIPLFATIESYIALCPKGDFLCGNRVKLSRWSFFTFVSCLMRSHEIGKMRNGWHIRYNPLFWAISYRRYKHLESNLRYVRVLTISKFVRRYLWGNYRINSTVIPNFIDVSMFRKKKQSHVKPRVLYLGNLVEHKGPRVLLEAAKGLDCRVELYGDGPLKKQLLNVIRGNELDAEIYPKAPYEKVPELYARADVVVFPSLWPEPFGRIAIEALAAGVPVVGSAIGGIEETIPPGAGMLVEPGNVGQLHDALKLLLANRQWLKEKGVRGQKFVEEHYSRGAVVKKLLQTYGAL